MIVHIGDISLSTIMYISTGYLDTGIIDKGERRLTKEIMADRCERENKEIIGGGSCFHEKEKKSGR